MNKNSMWSRRQFLKMMGTMAGASAVAACVPVAEPGIGGGETDTAGGEPPASQEGLTLRYRTWLAAGQSEGDAAWHDWLQENYPEASGGVQVEFEYVPFGSEYIQKVLADSAAGTPPDLLHSSIIWAREFYDRGVLLELDDYLANVPELAPDQFYGHATNEYRSKNGRYYGVPWDGPEATVIAVNSTLLEEAGFDPQGGDIQTWDDFGEVARALTVRDGDEITRAGFLSSSFRNIVTFCTWLRSNGDEPHNQDLTEATFNNDRSVEVLQFYLDLMEQTSFPIAPDLQDEQLFMQGQVAMIEDGNASAARYVTQAPEGFRYWYIVFPQGPQGDGPASTTWSNMFVLPRQIETADAAFDLMKYCTTPPVVITRFEFTTRTSPHKSIYESEAWQQMLEEVPARATNVPAAEIGGVYPFYPFFTEANDAIGIELEQVMTGGKDIQEALNDADRKINEVIERRTTS